MAIVESKRARVKGKKVKQAGEVKLLNVTRKMAHEWLDNAEELGFENRDPSSLYVQRYKGAMNTIDPDSPTGTGFYADTGETIKLAKCKKTGLVYAVDGRHRLTAFLESDLRDHPFLVYMYVDPDRFQYLDQGNTRDLKQVIGIHGRVHGGNWHANPGAFSSFAYYAHKQIHSGDAGIQPKADERLAAGNMLSWLIEEYPELPELYESIEPELKNIQSGNLGSAGMWLFLYNEMALVDEEVATDVLLYVEYMAKRHSLQSKLAKTQSNQRTLEKHTQALNDLLENPVKPPHKLYEYAVKRVLDVRRDNQEKKSNSGALTTGKAANQFVSVLLPQAYLTAFRIHVGDEPKTMKRYKKLLAHYGANMIGNVSDKLPL